ncbi:MAG: hypothetical protein EBR62_04180 [Verrucomicrobia bacterium]|nr:hypothetical protein [Verrucomicrobiota bacterium]
MMNEDRFGVVTFTFDPASVAAATSAEQTVTVNGLKVGDVVVLSKPTATAGVGIVNCRVSAANTLAVTFVNATASPVDPASETYTAFWFRPEKTVAGAVNP